MFCKQIKRGLLSLPLLLLLTGCASTCVVNEPVRCEHPLVDVRTNGGMASGLLLYKDALDQCNALNGVLTKE